MSSQWRRPVPLAPEHDIDGFDCGEPSLNNWLAQRARYNQAEGYSQTFVIADADGKVAAYGCLSAGAIARQDMPRAARTGQAPAEIPVAILGRLAVASQWQGQQLGARMLQHLILTAAGARTALGIRALIVDAISDDAQRFYERYGFMLTPLPGRRLVLALNRVGENG
ncbi:MAG: GNAT family N-acetyltransferase [Phyllobacteriaceae bacterium]|nr:GNAT family N-acetyltransferase [Phyllobacteriaceae bacterium]